MAKRTPEERSESARKAALAKAELARLPKATHESADHPLKIGDIEIPCYVLEDGTRVLSQRGVVGGLGMSYGSRAGGADRLTSFLSGKAISPFVSNDLTALIANPIKFKTSLGGGIAFGYPATILADICDVVLSARRASALQQQQQHIAEQCEILVRGFARVGIIALVDEATGYQKDRAKDALAKILEAFVAKEIQPWVKTFPADYYEHLCRLRGLPYPPERMQMPRYFGVLTNDIVYHRLAPGVLEALKKEAAKAEKRTRLHQHLTHDHGHIKLRELIASIVTIMKLSPDYANFIGTLNRIHQRYGDTIPLDLESTDR